MPQYRTETDSLGAVKVPSDKLWGAQTERALKYFDIGTEPMPRELIRAFAVIKKCSALANASMGVLSNEKAKLIAKICDEILAEKHADMFPLKVWISGSGTQFNMNVNEVIANRASELAGRPLGSKVPLHPNDDVNMSQSTNDALPSAIHIAATESLNKRLLPALRALQKSLSAKATAWRTVVKIGRTHLQDATPITLGQEFGGYAALLGENIERIADALKGIYRLAMGGTAVGTGVNAPENFDKIVAENIAKLTGLPFVPAPDKFAVQGSHDALVHLSGTLRTLAVSLRKIADDIRLLSSGPRAGLGELVLPANEPGSSIMPGKVNPTQCEALSQVCVQVMANDAAVGMGGAGGHLEMNAFKPLIAFNILQSIRLLSDGMASFREFLVVGMRHNKERLSGYIENSLQLATALSPIIGYDKSAKVARYAVKHGLSIRTASLKLGVLKPDEFDKIANLTKMALPHDACRKK